MSTPLGAARADLDAVEAIVRRAGTSFYRGMKILPPDRRAAMYAIYAFCRVVDDIADEPAPEAEKRAGLAAWRARIARLAEGQADDDPICRVLLPALQKFQLRPADFLAVIDGMQTDAETIVVAPPYATLDLYCDRVAAAVGRLSVRAFGDASPEADRVAYHLGRALQLTNILRDLAEDFSRFRLYLPREYLDAEEIPPEPETARAHPALGRVCARVADDAAAHFAEAFAAMDRCDPRAMRPARAMAASYRAVFDALSRRGWDRPLEVVTVPKWRKLLIAARFALPG